MHLRNTIMRPAGRMAAWPGPTPALTLPAHRRHAACRFPDFFSRCISPDKPNEIDSESIAAAPIGSSKLSGMIRIHFTGYSQKAAIYRPPFFISSNASAQNKRPGDL
ncbi:hypothetical protein [Chitinilyticum litopenaei]|uniref:hypothetical protein n=1 Tax=Chitinilyticum litopenaei TaxID=1121276 RepID=UPI00118701EF|nr:hypothetical protein [Chitinilyticum litopenaei]